MPTSASSSTTRASRALRARPRWAFSASPIWKPTVKQGFSDDIGSWKIIAMSRPARRRRWSARASSGVGPSNAMISALTRRGLRQKAHGGQHRHRLARARFADDRQDLVAIDATSTPSTAVKAPRRVAKRTVRFLMSRRGMDDRVAGNGRRGRPALWPSIAQVWFGVVASDTALAPRPRSERCRRGDGEGPRRNYVTMLPTRPAARAGRERARRARWTAIFPFATIGTRPARSKTSPPSSARRIWGSSADVRTIPRSRANPQFNADTLPDALAAWGLATSACQNSAACAEGPRTPTRRNGFWENAVSATTPTTP